MQAVIQVEAMMSIVTEMLGSQKDEDVQLLQLFGEILGRFLGYRKDWIINILFHFMDHQKRNSMLDLLNLYKQETQKIDMLNSLGQSLLQEQSQNKSTPKTNL